MWGVVIKRGWSKKTKKGWKWQFWALFDWIFFFILRPEIVKWGVVINGYWGYFLAMQWSKITDNITDKTDGATLFDIVRYICLSVFLYHSIITILNVSGMHSKRNWSPCHVYGRACSPSWRMRKPPVSRYYSARLNSKIVPVVWRKN